MQIQYIHDSGYFEYVKNIQISFNSGTFKSATAA